MSAMTSGGIVLRVEPGDDGLAFIPASIALRVAPPPATARVPGAPRELVGIAAHEGDVLPVVAIGGGQTAMVVCAASGELVGLVGGTVLATGVFDANGAPPGGVVYEGTAVRPLDVASIVARIQAGARGERWGG